MAMVAIPSSEIPRTIPHEPVDVYCCRIYVSPFAPAKQEDITGDITAFLRERGIYLTEASFNMHPRPMKETARLPAGYFAAFAHLQFISIDQAKAAAEALTRNPALVHLAPPGELLVAGPCSEMHTQQLPGRWGIPRGDRRSRTPRPPVQVF